MSLDLNNKTLVIFEILKRLVEKREIYPSDTQLLDELGIKERTLRRHMDKLKFCFPTPLWQKINS